MRSLLSAAAVALASAQNLPNVAINPGLVSTSGISAGAFMATQVHVAFSSMFTGVGVLAGGPYFCAQGQLSTAFTECMYIGSSISDGFLQVIAELYAAAGDIDPLSNLASSRVWAFSATGDTVVSPSVVQHIPSWYSKWVSSANIKTIFDMPGEHSQQTLNYGNSCTNLGEPYINNCDFDAAGSILQHIYYNKLTPPSSQLRTAYASEAIIYALGGSLAAPVRIQEKGTMMPFSQSTYFPSGSFLGVSGLSDTAYIFVPDACAKNGPAGVAANATCPLHVAFHGCEMDTAQIGLQYVFFGGYVEWAITNNIVIVFPQASEVMLSNPNACFDWWGYTNSNYAKKSGPQMATVGNIVTTLLG